MSPAAQAEAHHPTTIESFGPALASLHLDSPEVVLDEVIQPLRPPLPSRDPTCSSCATPATEPHLFKKTKRQYLAGEIVRINESVHTLIERLFEGQPHAPQEATAPQRSTQPHTAHRCDGRDSYMLMATYTSTHQFRDLPLVLKHFCVPVSPHCEICEDVEHLHTTPEWQGVHSWMIVHPFYSPGAVVGGWEWKNAGGKRQKGHSFKVDRQELARLFETSKRKYEEWSTTCLQEGYPEDCYKDYRAFMQQSEDDKRSRERIYSNDSDLGAASHNSFQTNREGQPMAPVGAPELDPTDQKEDVGCVPLDAPITGGLRTVQPQCAPLNVGEPPVGRTELDSGNAASTIAPTTSQEEAQPAGNKDVSAAAIDTGRGISDGSQAPGSTSAQPAATSAPNSDGSRNPEGRGTRKLGKKSRGKLRGFFSKGDGH